MKPATRAAAAGVAARVAGFTYQGMAEASRINVGTAQLTARR